VRRESQWQFLGDTHQISISVMKKTPLRQRNGVVSNAFIEYKMPAAEATKNIVIE
jgi:hypothetical protein